MKKFYLTILLCQIVLIASCQPKRSNIREIIIPMDVTTYRPIIELTIDGKGPYKFIFDTGSATNVIDEKLNDELGLKIVGEDSLKTQGPQSLISKRTMATRISFSNTNISKEVEMNVVNLRGMLPIDGVLSASFFEDYLITMDYPKSQLILTKGELNRDDKQVASFTQGARTLNVEILVDGHLVEAHLDTGSPGGFSLPYALKNQLTYKQDPKEGHEIRTPVATYKRWDAELVGSVVVGNAIYENPQIGLVEGFEFANMGYQVIKDLRISVDRKNSLVMFEKSNASRSRKETGQSPKKRKLQDGLSTSNSSPFSGSYEGDRKVWVNSSNELVYQRASSPVLELILVEKNLYELKVPNGVRTPMEIPKVLFIKDSDGLVVELEFVYSDVRKDGPFKKTSN